MTSHDPLCPKYRWYKSHYVSCCCYLIKEVQQRERTNIATAIENEQQYWHQIGKAALDVAATIARDGGNNAVESVQ